MLCAELREKALHFVVPPENSLRKRDVFFEKVGRFVTKQGNFFVFVAHFSIALTEFALRRGSRTTRSALLVLSSRPLDFHLHSSPLFLSRTRPYAHVAIAYAHFTEFRFSMFTLHLASNYFVMSVLR